MLQKLDTQLARCSSPMLSVFRIVFGLLFTLHGTMKVFGWPLGEAVPVLNWPFWWAGLIEVVIGILITVGFLTRIAALIGAGQMAVAYFWRHTDWFGGEPASFWPFSNGGNGGEMAILYCFAFLLLAAMGAGAWSVDARRRGTAEPGT
ncbi:MAG: DoxX family protein [Mycobacterium sp.]